MLIQNTGTMAQAPQPVRLASDTAPAVVVPTPSNTEAKASTPVELPQLAVKQVAEQKVSPEQLQNAVAHINKAMAQANRSLTFSLDADSQRPLVKLIDSDTGDLIRQFPSEDALAISKSIEQLQQGMLLNQKA